MVGTANSPRARALGSEIKAARKTANMTTRQLGERLNRDHSYVSRWENGKTAPSVEDTAAILGILGVTGAERDRIVKLARDAADPNWVTPGVRAHLSALMDYERTAHLITNAEPLLVPGLLQTGDYARSLMESAGATSAEAEQRVTYRMGRRDILEKRNPVQFSAIIGEVALRYPPCDRMVMHNQLEHLRKYAELDNVTIQCMPLDRGYSPALEGPFVLIEFERDEPIVQLEHYRSATTLTDRGDVRDYQTAADSLRREAMSPEDTTELIAGLEDEMEYTT